MHPVLFEIPMPWGDQPVYSYGVMLGTSLLVAWYTIMYLGEKKETLSAEVMRNTFIVTAITAILFARLLYALTNLDEFHSLGDLFNLQGGGLVAYGGFLGGLVGAWGFLRWKKESILAWADLVAPTLGTGLGLVRVGLIPATELLQFPEVCGPDLLVQLLERPLEVDVRVRGDVARFK